MKQLLTVLALLVSVQLLGQEELLPTYESAPKVMILGMYHMSNPGQDAANVKADDVKTPKRQQEIKDLLARLAEFKPTKIAVERVYGSEAVATRYQNYLQMDHDDSLSRSETQQLGFRLAKMLGHEWVYPIDYRLNISPPSMGKLMQEDPEKGAYVGQFTAKIQQYLDASTKEHLYDQTISHYLSYMNSDEMIEGNYQVYLEFLKNLFKGDNYAGAEMLSLWTKRNIIIFQHLTRIVDYDNEDERVLVIFGQGHAKILRDLVSDARYLELVDVKPYLK